MSDTSGVPNTPAPAAPAPAPANEVPVNPNPTQTPQPIGNQAPEKTPEAPKSQPESRREAIKAAFDRAQDKREADEKPERRPGRDHNRPPERVDDEPKKPPARAEQPRDQGRFAPRQPAEGQAPGQQPGQQRQPGQTGQQAPRLPETAPYRDPPPRMADHAKGEWAGTPEKVRGEFHRLAQEAEGMHRAYRADYDEMETIRPFSQMAKQHGTSLQRALTNYVSMEQKLRSDVVGGLDVIVNNLNLRADDGTKIGLRDVAYHILNQTPEQHKLVQSGNHMQAQSNQIGQLHQMVESLAHGFQQMQTERQFTQTRSAVDQYADQHPRFDELGDLIEQELKLGFTLDQAYARAELLRPSTRAAQTRNPTAQTRQADKSISGAPESGPSNGTGRRNSEKPVDRRAAILNSIRSVQGGI